MDKCVTTVLVRANSDQVGYLLVVAFLLAVGLAFLAFSLRGRAGAG